MRRRFHTRVPRQAPALDGRTIEWRISATRPERHFRLLLDGRHLRAKHVASSIWLPAPTTRTPRLLSQDAVVAVFARVDNLVFILAGGFQCPQPAAPRTASAKNRSADCNDRYRGEEYEP